MQSELTKMQEVEMYPALVKLESNCSRIIYFIKRSITIETVSSRHLGSSTELVVELRSSHVVKMAKFHCIGTFLFTCEYRNLQLFVRTVDNRPWFFRNERVFRIFSEFACMYCVRRAGCTSHTQALREAHFTEAFATGRTKLCTQFYYNSCGGFLVAKVHI